MVRNSKKNSKKKYNFCIVDFDLFDEKIDNPGFLGYKVNISFLTKKLPYSQICGTKVSPS